MPYSKNPIRICEKCSKEYHCKNNSHYCDDCRSSEKACVVCGKSFKTRLSHPTERFTCSKICMGVRKSELAISNRAMIRPPCANCGKPITRKYIAYGKRKKKHLFCNTKCYGEWRGKNVTADFHPRYKGGYEGYYGPGWLRQRMLARKRDLVCQRCGKSPEENGKSLDVHHIVAFREFGIERAKEAHDLGNLISYCASCHTLVEWENGKEH